MIIDDDPHNNLLCGFVIGTVTKQIEIINFTIPQEGFDYIEDFYKKNEPDCPTVLFLDINMPVMSGWDFLDKYATLDEHIKKQITIYILSSSLDWNVSRPRISRQFKNN